MEIKEITKRQFDAYCYVRDPFLNVISSEKAWYEAYGRKLVGTVIFDFTDRDFGYVILGRDERKVFRAIELPRTFFKSKDEAAKALVKALEKYKEDGRSFYPQRDQKALPNDFLIPKVPESKLHPYFKLLSSHRGYEAARNLIQEIVYSYVDVDGNYIKDFQTTGFDARLWELYLYIFLHSNGFRINNTYQAPDYVVEYFGQTFCIEAVTVNANRDFDEPPPKDPKEAFLLSRDYMPIKFGSPLFSKLKKRYWEKPHVQGKPLILAIHDFHMAATLETLGSMTWSRTALIDYLYGTRMKSSLEGGRIVTEVRQTKDGVAPITEEIKSHHWKGKTIPSGFFFQPDSQNISAVLFSNNATLTAFNRMGKLAGLGSADSKMIRHCIVYDPDPNAVEPIVKSLDVDSPEYEEAWDDGLVMYHNPNAKHPVDRRAFPTISHMYFDASDKTLYGYTQPYEVLASQTWVIIPKKEVTQDVAQV